MPSWKQLGFVVRDSLNEGNQSTLLVGQTFSPQYGSGTSLGQLGKIDMALTHFTYENQINTLDGADDGTGTGWIIEGRLTGSTNAGQLVALVNYDGNTTIWKPAYSSDGGTAPRMLGINLISGEEGNFTQILLKGFYCTEEASYYQNPSSNGAGVPLYIGTISGTVTSDAPTSSGSYVRIIGDVWRSQQGANASARTIIYFNPQNVFTYIE
jgi:hypothetical protein